MNAKMPLSKEDLSNKKYIYLTTNYIPKGQKTFTYNESNRKINLSYEPNDLFVKRSYTNVSDVDGIVYFVNKQTRLFEQFINDAERRTIQEIVVYFLRYNDTPLYLIIVLTPIENPGKDYRLYYKLNLKGEWVKASHYYYIFGELKSQALAFNMLQYFEIEKTETDYPRDRIGPAHPHIDVSKNKTGDFKFYKHFMEENIKITKFFTYRNRILKDIIVTDKDFYQVDVYYHTYDFKNNLPLMIIVHKSDKTREYFVNQGGNYKWKKDEHISYYGDEKKLGERLNQLREELMGEMVSLDIEHIPSKYIPEQYEDYKDLLCLRQNEGDLKYTSCKFYYEDGRRFSIHELTSGEYKIKFPDLTLYSIQKFYTFHNGSYELPMFMCAVYEKYHNEIYDWYQLVNRKGSTYEVSYLLSGDPAKFKDLMDVIRIYETKLFQLDFEIARSLARKDYGGYREVVNIDDHNFDKHYQIFDGNHKKYVLSPTYGNFFTIKSLTFYDEKVLDKEFKFVKEVHVFEHYNYFHYKVCIITSNYNYTTGLEEKEHHWYEFRKGTNISDNWILIGKLTGIKKMPHEYENDSGMKDLMNETNKIEYDGKHKEVFYKPQHYPFPGMPYQPPKPGTRIPTHYEGGRVDLEAGGISERQTEDGSPITPLVGGLIGSGAGVGIVSVTGGYLIYSNFGAISSAFASLIR